MLFLKCKFKINTFQDFLNKGKNIYDCIRKFNQLINFERKKKVKKTYTKKEVDQENKDSSSNIAPNSNVKGSYFGFLKDEDFDISNEKDLDEKNKLDIHQISDFCNNEDNEEYNILNLKTSPKGKKIGRIN